MKRILFILTVAASVAFGGYTKSGGYGGSLYPPTSGLVQWLHGVDGSNVLARVGDDAALKDVNCLESSGSDTWTISAITGTESASNQGTASVVVSANTLTFGVGTIHGVSVDGVGFYPCGEGQGVPADTSGNGNHATSNAATWTTVDGIESANHRAGHTPAVVNAQEGSDNFIDVGEAMGTQWEATFRVERTPITGSAYDFGAILTSPVRRNHSIFSTSGEFRVGWRNTILNFGVKEVGSVVHVVVDDGVVTVDNVTQIVSGDSADLPDINAYIMSCNIAGSPSNSGAISCLHFRNGPPEAPTRDMIPLRNGRFLDRVNNVIYSNDGTGELATRYSPALSHVVDGKVEALPTKSVTTFDGVGGFVRAVSGSPIADSFDIEVEFSSTQADSYRNIISKANEASDDRVFNVYYRNDGEIFLQFSSSGTSWDFTLTTTGGTMNDGSLHTLLITKSGTTVTLYQDGNVIGSGTCPATLYSSSERVIVSGKNRSSAGPFACNMLRASVTGELSYDFTTYTGKTIDVVTDLSGNGNDGTIVTGAGGLEAFWGTRFATDSGILVDAENFLPITYSGGYVHNNSECSIETVTGTYSYEDLFSKTNDTDTLRVSIGDDLLVRNAFEYSPAPTGADLDRLNLYLDILK